MKHSPGQGSLHRGKFHPDEECITKPPTGFRRMLSAQPTLKFSSSDTQKVASILSREGIRLFGIYFQRANVEREVHRNNICGSYICSWGSFPTLRADPDRKTCQFFMNLPGLYFQCCHSKQDTDFNSSCGGLCLQPPHPEGKTELPKHLGTCVASRDFCVCWFHFPLQRAVQNHPGVRLSVPWKIIGIGRWHLKHRGKWEVTTQESWKDELHKQQGKVMKDCICAIAAEPCVTHSL